MNNFCVYTHWHHDTGYPVCFYVGKAKNEVGNRGGYRPTSRASRSAFWYRVANKHGFTPVIVKADLTEEQAFALEVHLISAIGRRDLGTGPLVNLTGGGEGQLQHARGPHTPETKAKMSASAKADVSRRGRTPWNRGVSGPQKGVPRTDEVKAKISAATRGKKRSLECRAQMSESRKGQIPWNKGVKGGTPWNKGMKLKNRW